MILEGAMDSNNKDFTETPTRLDKTLSWLKISRNSWKEKTRESKTKLKIATLGIKRARESRDEIEKELHDRQKQLDQKDAEIAMLKNKLEQATQEVETLKKKR
jgi:chromosome segregation ATPase